MMPFCSVRHQLRNIKKIKISNIKKLLRNRFSIIISNNNNFSMVLKNLKKLRIINKNYINYYNIAETFCDFTLDYNLI